MSADDGIYILKTKKGDGFEYRVEHLQAVENVDWDENLPNSYHGLGDHTDDDDVRIKNAREMWKHSPIFVTQESAFANAQQVYEEVNWDGFPVEYGISVIAIDREF